MASTINVDINGKIVDIFSNVAKNKISIHTSFVIQQKYCAHTLMCKQKIKFHPMLSVVRHAVLCVLCPNLYKKNKLQFV